MTALTSDQVRRIAHLARIALTDQEVERFRGELSVILDHCDALSVFDTDGVPPTKQTFQMTNVLRPDEAAASQDRAAILANAPRAEDGYFRVRAVLE